MEGRIRGSGSLTKARGPERVVMFNPHCASYAISTRKFGSLAIVFSEHEASYFTVANCLPWPSTP